MGEDGAGWSDTGVAATGCSEVGDMGSAFGGGGEERTGRVLERDGGRWCCDGEPAWDEGLLSVLPILLLRKR